MFVAFIQLLRYGLRTASGTNDVQRLSLSCACVNSAAKVREKTNMCHMASFDDIAVSREPLQHDEKRSLHLKTSCHFIASE